VKNRSLQYGQYFQNAKKENWDTVAMVDKKALIDYVEGKIDTCAQIDTNMPNLPMSSSLKRSVNEKETADKTSEPRKIQRVESIHGDAQLETKNDGPENTDEWTIDQIHAQEREKFTPADCMRVRADFGFALRYVRELMSERGSREKKTMDVTRQPRENLRPIILVPYNMTSILNMYNAKQFLEGGKYVFPEEIYRSNYAKANRMLITRTFQRNVPTRYMVAEKLPEKSDEPTWKRVVAVVVTGKSTQFKSYPFKGCENGDVYDLLHNHVQGFYFQYHDDNFSESEASSWKVKVLTVHRYRRHGDNLLMQQFWTQLDQFILDKKLDRVFKY